MIYCVADIHGRLDLFEQLLELIRFSSDDTLYVLGDCIDRGGGLAVLDRVMQMQEHGQAQFIPGNHEMNFVNHISKFNSSLVSKLYCCDLLFAPKNRKSGASFFDKYQHVIEQIQHAPPLSNPAKAATILTMYDTHITYEDYFERNAQARKKIVDFITSAPTHIDIEVSGRPFRLLHAGCRDDGTADMYMREEFYQNPSPLQNTTIIFGHVPTKDIRMLTAGVGTDSSIWYDSRHDNDKIGIDGGCCFAGGKLACLRLDDMKEFYVDNTTVYYETEEEIVQAVERITANRFG